MILSSGDRPLPPADVCVVGAGSVEAQRWLRRRRHGGMLANPAGRYLLRYHAEQAPNPESRMVLREAGGGSTLSVHYHVGDQDVASVLRSHAILDRWLRQNGLRLEYLREETGRAEAILAQAYDGFHQIGLARMSADPADGVVDRNCQAHGIATCMSPARASFRPAARPTRPCPPSGSRSAWRCIWQT